MSGEIFFGGDHAFCFTHENFLLYCENYCLLKSSVIFVSKAFSASGEAINNLLSLGEQRGENLGNIGDTIVIIATISPLPQDFETTSDVISFSPAKMRDDAPMVLGRMCQRETMTVASIIAGVTKSCIIGPTHCGAQGRFLAEAASTDCKKAGEIKILSPRKGHIFSPRRTQISCHDQPTGFSCKRSIKFTGDRVNLIQNFCLIILLSNI